MPEIITKFPEIVISVLKGAGALCGQGVPQEILTSCPPEQFCSLPTGEICVYGINQINDMTQVGTAELTAGGRPTLILIAIAALVVGFVIGYFLTRKKFAARKK